MGNYHVGEQTEVCWTPSDLASVLHSEGHKHDSLPLPPNTGFTAGFMRPHYNKHCRSLRQIPAEEMHRFHECNNVENVQYIDMAGALCSAVPRTMNNLI